MAEPCPKSRGVLATLLLALLVSPAAYAAPSDDPHATADIRRSLTLLNVVAEEYREGVVDGRVVLPLEYQEAKTFLDEAQARLRTAAPAAEGGGSEESRVVFRAPRSIAKASSTAAWCCRSNTKRPRPSSTKRRRAYGRRRRQPRARRRRRLSRPAPASRRKRRSIRCVPTWTSFAPPSCSRPVSPKRSTRPPRRRPTADARCSPTTVRPVTANTPTGAGRTPSAPRQPRQTP